MNKIFLVSKNNLMVGGFILLFIKNSVMLFWNKGYENNKNSLDIKKKNLILRVGSVFEWIELKIVQWRIKLSSRAL
jgi:hypothetical protein